MPQRSSPFDYRGAGIRHADYLAALVDGSPGEPLLRAAGKLARFAREHTAAWEAHRAARIALGKGAPDNTALRRGERTARWALARARVALYAAREAFRIAAARAGAGSGESARAYHHATRIVRVPLQRLSPSQAREGTPVTSNVAPYRADGSRPEWREPSRDVDAFQRSARRILVARRLLGIVSRATPHAANLAAMVLAAREGRGKPRPADWHGVRIAPEHTRARFVRADRRATSRAARYFAHAQACETRDRRDSVPRAIGAGDAQHVRARLGGTMVRPAPVVAPPTAGPSHVYRAPPRRGTQCTRKGAVVAAVVERRR